MKNHLYCTYHDGAESACGCCKCEPENECRWDEPKERHWHCNAHYASLKLGNIWENRVPTCCCHHPNGYCSKDAAERSESEKDPTSDVNPQTGLERSKCCGATVRLANAYEGTNLYVCSKCKLTCHLKATEEQDRQRRIEEITSTLGDELGRTVNSYYGMSIAKAIVKCVLEIQKL